MAANRRAVEVRLITAGRYLFPERPDLAASRTAAARAPRRSAVADA
jgi:hypothetical protein